MGLTEHIESIPPAELARLRNTRQDTSTRDKQRLLKKAAEIEGVLSKIGVKFILEKA